MCVSQMVFRHSVENYEVEGSTGAGASEFGVYSPPSVSVRVEPMLRMQGYKDLSRVRPRVHKVAQQMATLVESEARPVVHHRRIGIVAHCDGHLSLDAGVTFQCPAFAKHLLGCTEVVATLLTLGRPLDELARAMTEEERLLEVLFLEAAGWLAIESTTKSFKENLKQVVAGRGMRITRRMAPGYTFPMNGEATTWRLEEQLLMHGLFDEVEHPIEILDSAAMIPKMSRSGLFGLRAISLN